MFDVCVGLYRMVCGASRWLTDTVAVARSRSRAGQAAGSWMRLPLLTPDRAPGRPFLQPGFRYSPLVGALARSEEHTSELQSLMRISYAVFCLKQKKFAHSYSSHSY